MWRFADGRCILCLLRGIKKLSSPQCCRFQTRLSYERFSGGGPMRRPCMIVCGASNFGEQNGLDEEGRNRAEYNQAHKMGVRPGWFAFNSSNDCANDPQAARVPMLVASRVTDKPSCLAAVQSGFRLFDCRSLYAHSPVKDTDGIGLASPLRVHRSRHLNILHMPRRFPSPPFPS